MSKEVSKDVRPLSPVESQLYIRNRQVIERGLKSFVEVGNALLEIQQRKLWRCDYDSFEKFMESEYDMSRQHGYRLIDAAKIDAELSPVGDNKPQSERAMRELVDVPEDRTVEVAERAAELAGGKPPTMVDIKKAKQELLTDDDDDEEELTQDEQFESMLNEVAEEPVDDPQNTMEISAGAIDECIKAINDAIRTIKAVPVQYGAELFDGRRRDLITDINIVKGNIKNLKPTGICPDCEGAAVDCVKCGNMGYVTARS